MYSLIARSTSRQHASTKASNVACQMVFLRGKKDSSDSNKEKSLFSSLLGSRKKGPSPSSFASYLDDEASPKVVSSDKQRSSRRPSSTPATPYFDNFTDAVVEAAKVTNGSGEKRFSVVLEDENTGGKTQSPSPVTTSNNASSSNSNSTPSANLNQLFKPVPVLPNPDDMNLGEEIAGKMNKQALLKTLNALYLSKSIKELSKEHGMDDYIYHQSYVSFRKFCMDVQHLPTDLYVLFSDVLQGARNTNDIFPYFLAHARKVFPHLECIDDLRNVGDLTNPPNWYPEARALNRKIVFHSGPTNSGKTYHALERFTNAKTGVYCGPLKMLAVEVFNKTNERGVDCDLVTGEERKYARAEQEPSEHVACTVEMANFNQTYEVAVIDEIQMVKDFQRGWAWTRALLGIPAHEIHVCGEGAAVDLVREMMISTGEEVEVRSYKRLTDLVIQDEAVQSLANVQPGDCIVCFSKQDIYAVSRGLERMGVDCAVIYGSLPPGAKLGMAAKFNDPDDPCKVLVATDAVGMGLNLNIRRVVFYSMTKLQLTEAGEKTMDTISVSQALQIAGRAGRFGTKWETGHVTTFKQEEIKIMKELLSQSPEEILSAGLHPTFDMLETYAYHLPNASLANLVDIFISLSTVDDSLYSLCQLKEFKFLADMVEHIKIPLKVKYTFCCAPINTRMPFVCTMFLKIARQFSRGELITFDWLCHQVGWPFSPPDTILDLVHLEAVHDVLDLYLWLSYRFQDMFPDVELVYSVRNELDTVIEEGVGNIVQLLRNADSGSTSGAARAAATDEDAFESKNRKIRQYKSWVHKPKPSESAAEDKETADDAPADSETAADAAAEAVEKHGSRLTDQLIAQGLLTKSMMSQLKREWRKEGATTSKKKKK